MDLQNIVFKIQNSLITRALIHGLLTTVTIIIILYYVAPPYLEQISVYIGQIKLINDEVTESSQEIRQLNNEYRKRYKEDFEVLIQLHEKLSDRALRDIHSINNMLEATKLVKNSKEAYKITFNIYDALIQVVFGTRDIHTAITVEAQSNKLKLLNDYGQNLLSLSERMKEFDEVTDRIEMRSYNSQTKPSEVSLIKSGRPQSPKLQERHYYALIKAKLGIFYHKDLTESEKQTILLEVEKLLEQYYLNFVIENSIYYDTKTRPIGFLILTMDDYPKEIISDSKSLIEYEKLRCLSYYEYLQGVKHLFLSGDLQTAKNNFQESIAKDPSQKYSNKSLRFYLANFQLWQILEKEITEAHLNSKEKQLLQTEILKLINDLKDHFINVERLRPDCNQPYARVLLGEFEWLPMLHDIRKANFENILNSSYSEFFRVFNKFSPTQQIKYQAQKEIIEAHFATYKVMSMGYQKTIEKLSERNSETTKQYVSFQIKAVNEICDIRKQWDDNRSGQKWTSMVEELKQNLDLKLSKIPFGLPSGIVIQIRRDLDLLSIGDESPFVIGGTTKNDSSIQ